MKKEPKTPPLLRAPKPEGAASHAASPGELGGRPPDLQMPRQSVAKRLISFPVLLGACWWQAFLCPCASLPSMGTFGGTSRWVGLFSLPTNGPPRTFTLSPRRECLGWPTNGWVKCCSPLSSEPGGYRGFWHSILPSEPRSCWPCTRWPHFARVTPRRHFGLRRRSVFHVCLFTLRPQMLAYVFLVLALIILERFRQGRSGHALAAASAVSAVGQHAWNIRYRDFCGRRLYLERLVRDSQQRSGVQTLDAAQRLQLESAFLASLVALTVTPYGPKLAAFPVDMAFSHPDYLN